MTGMTVGVLLYGDHPVLAKRCLDPLWPLHRDGAIRLRIGCNECGPATLDYLQRNGAYDDQAIGLVVSAKNIHKYPMMRQLIALAPLTPNFMWFDDDSYVDATGPVQLIGTVADKLGRYDMVGQVWGHHLGGRQHLWVKDQPWYGGKPVAPDHRVRFCQGAWWAIRSAHLATYDWPDPALERKGGDVMLGELCRQQGLSIFDVGPGFGVRINADAQGRHSKMPTRGPMPVPRPIGWDYTPGVTARVLDTVGGAPQE